SNRHIRARLLFSSAAFAAYAAIAAGIRFGSLSSSIVAELGAVGPLLVAFGVLNAIVALAINPWRSDRLPDRFPTIVQDVIVVALFAIVAALVLQDRLFAATAAGAVV